MEAIHRAHAVAVRDGEVVAALGDPDLVTLFRSSAKPLQALPLARARPDVDDEELAIASASHGASEQQVEIVRRLLAASGSTEAELECGLDGARPPIFHNCSGKHAAMLAVCKARGLPLPGYRHPDHPLQRELAAEIADAGGVGELPLADDGCGVPTFALPLAAMARSFSVLGELDGGSRVVAAMRAHPELLQGPVRVDVELMLALPGWIAKGGAEGLFCALGPDGLGVAVKIEDGAYRAIGPALAAFLPLVGQELPAFARVPIRNSLGDEVGEAAVE